MLKVYPSCLLLTLVFSSAHAPTFHLWRNLASASTDTASIAATDYLDSHASHFDADQFATTREYAEDTDLHRFGLDEFYLPQLDVDLPELFKWSDGERNYLASNTLPTYFGHSLDNVPSIAFRSGGANIGYGGGSGFSAQGGGISSSASQSDSSTNLSSKGASTNTSTESPVSDIASSVVNDATNDDLGNESEPTDNQLAKNEPVTNALTPIDSALLPPLIDPIRDHTLVDAQKPVQVPAPGAFGLFVLGLAGLRFVGRKKNGSG